MISAPSRRLLLSGSNIWLVLLSLLLIGACSSQRNAGGSAPKGYEVIDNKPEPTKPPKPPMSPKDTIPPQVDVITDSIGKYKHKAVYNVALILPFYLDSFPTATGGIYPQSRIGTEYYKGVVLALDSLKSIGLSVKLHVYDSYPESSLEVLIKANQLKQMDLILGPVFNSSMKLMAKYALEAGIPVWSPFSPASDITAQNPYFYIANPRQETHAHQMISYAVDSFKQSKLLVLYQFSEQEKKFMEIYRNFVEDHNRIVDLYQGDSLKKNPLYKPYKIKLHEKFIENSAGVSTGSLTTLLDAEKHNVILIPSMKIPFAVNVLRELFPLASKYQITLIGTPTLGNDVDLQVDYLNALDVHFTQSYYLKPGFYESAFYKSFVTNHGIEPSEYAINGFDQMLFLGSMMKRYGQSFRVQMGRETFNGWGNGFTMRPVTLPDNTIEYWDNQHLYILRYKDLTLEQIK